MFTLSLLVFILIGLAVIWKHHTDVITQFVEYCVSESARRLIRTTDEYHRVLLACYGALSSVDRYVARLARRLI